MPIDWIHERMATICGASEAACEGENRAIEAMMPEKEAVNNQEIQNVDGNSQRNVLNLDLQDVDIGYSSHGTQDDSSQQSITRLTEWQEVNQDECMHGDDDLDDLLYHFNNFFKEKLDTELENFQDSMKSILREQQIHIRQIVHSTVSTTGDQEIVDSQQQHMDTCDTNISSKRSTRDEENIPSTSENCLKQFKEESENRLLTELLSLSCGITAILHDQKYRL